jgi:NADH-quinone oxidoreductase subunit C
MTPEAIADLLKERFGDAITDIRLEGAHPHVTVKPEAWLEVAAFLRDDPRLAFDWLRCISGVDYLEEGVLAAVYEFHSTQPPSEPAGLWSARHNFAVKVKVPRDNPHIPSVAHLWSAADWHEREAYDLLGIVFDNHPDLVEGPDGPHPRRILCPDDWAGHPLRKDYEFPLEYHGIPAVTEMEQTRPQH